MRGLCPALLPGAGHLRAVLTRRSGPSGSHRPRRAPGIVFLLLALLQGGGCRAPGGEPRTLLPALACDEQVFQAGLELASTDLGAVLARLEGRELCLRGQLVLALTRLAQGNLEEGLATLRAVAAQRADDPRAALLAEELAAAELAGVQSRQGEALAAAERALQLDPRSFRARLLRALLQQALLRQDAALRDAMVLALQSRLPADASELFVKDLVRWVLDMLTDGEPLPEEAPAAVHRVVGRLLSMESGRCSGASYRQLKERALRALQLGRRELATASPQDILLEAHEYAALLRFPEAIELLQRWLVLRPEDIEAHLLLLQTLQRVGRHEEVIRLDSLPIEQCPACLLEIAESHAKLGDGAELALLEELHRRFPAQPSVLALLGQTLVQRGELERGASMLRQSLEATPDDLGVLNLLAVAENRLGRAEQAAELARRYREAHDAAEEATREGEKRSNVASSYDEALAALARGDLTRVQQLVAFIEQREARFPLLPLLRMALASKQGRPPSSEDAAELLEAALARNGWLTKVR